MMPDWFSMENIWKTNQNSLSGLVVEVCAHLCLKGWKFQSGNERNSKIYINVYLFLEALWTRSAVQYSRSIEACRNPKKPKRLCEVLPKLFSAIAMIRLQSIEIRWLNLHGNSTAEPCSWASDVKPSETSAPGAALSWNLSIEIDCNTRQKLSGRIRRRVWDLGRLSVRGWKSFEIH